MAKRGNFVGRGRREVGCKVEEKDGCVSVSVFVSVSVSVCVCVCVL